MAPRRKGGEFCQRLCSLTGKNAVAESGERLSMAQPHVQIGHPPPVESHEPFHERGRGAWTGLFAQDGGSWGGSAGDSFPSGDSFGVASPASKNSSISANSVSGDDCRPRRATRSIT